MNYTGPKVKLARALGIPLTPKAARYMEKRPYPPGEHGRKAGRRRESIYKIQLREKQRLRAQYNIGERQLRNYFRKASRKKGNAGANLLRALEMRLDAVVLRGGLARTIYASRQYVVHGHVTVNGKRVNVPGQTCRVGDVISIREKSRKMLCFMDAMESSHRVPYLELDKNAWSLKVTGVPEREDVPIICDVIMVVEFYSRMGA
ncbi:MAG: 30S ribosomal protein S4 [Acidobacteriota bacterium]